MEWGAVTPIAPATMDAIDKKVGMRMGKLVKMVSNQEIDQAKSDRVLVFGEMVT